MLSSCLSFENPSQIFFFLFVENCYFRWPLFFCWEVWGFGIILDAYSSPTSPELCFQYYLEGWDRILMSIYF